MTDTFPTCEAARNWCSTSVQLVTRLMDASSPLVIPVFCQLHTLAVVTSQASKE